MSPSGPVQLITASKRRPKLAAAAPGQRHPIAFDPDDPGGRDLEPSRKRASPRSGPPPAGAIRCRWTSHQGRKWRRKRLCSASVRPRHKAMLCGLRPSTDARQGSRARTARTRSPSRSGGSHPSGAAAGERWARGTSPRREAARIRPGEARFLEADRHVDHGEAGSDQQQLAAARRRLRDRRRAFRRSTDRGSPALRTPRAAATGSCRRRGSRRRSRPARRRPSRTPSSSTATASPVTRATAGAPSSSPAR